MKRTLTESLKKKIAGKQFYKCANNPHVVLKRLENYQCPLWKIDNINKGSFDESGYEIDHIIEFSDSGNDNESNLQALCVSCHKVKTKEYMRIRNNKIIKPDIREDINTDKILWNMMSEIYDDEIILMEHYRHHLF